MGDFSIVDEYTQGLLDTLERLGMRKPDPLIKAIFEARIQAAKSFGMPGELMMSPKQFSEFYKKDGE